MEVIYLVTPTLETVNRILKDFADPKKPRYGDVHLFFLSKVCRFLLFWGDGGVASLPFPRCVCWLAGCLSVWWLVGRRA